MVDTLQIKLLSDNAAKPKLEDKEWVLWNTCFNFGLG